MFFVRIDTGIGNHPLNEHYIILVIIVGFSLAYRSKLIFISHFSLISRGDKW